MRKKYLQFFPIASDRTADLLKTEAVWECLREVRESGLKGITAEELARKTDRPDSTVYAALNRLWQHGFVGRRRLGREERWERIPAEEKREKLRGVPKEWAEVKKPGKTPRIFFEACDVCPSFQQSPQGEPENPWGDVVFSQEFAREIGPILDKFIEDTRLEGRIHECLRSAYEECQRKRKVSHLMPSVETCPRCKRSHEGNEFMKAMVLYIAARVLESPKYTGLLKELEFSK